MWDKTMKKILLVLGLVAMVGFVAGQAARADTLTLGANYTTITMTGTMFGSSPSPIGGGNIHPSTLDGQPLLWVYCVDLNNSISVPPTTYDATTVSTTGIVNGTVVNNVNQVAWLLHTYAGTATSYADQVGLQAAIWTTIYGSSAAALDTTNPGPNSSDAITAYQNDLNALSSATIGNYVGNYDWLTLGKTGDPVGTLYQGLVTQVPEPATLILLGLGLFGLGLVGLKRRQKV